MFCVQQNLKIDVNSGERPKKKQPLLAYPMDPLAGSLAWACDLMNLAPTMLVME